MLTRVFPFHPKSAVESVLESCGGDVARAVQQLVGNQKVNNENATSQSPIVSAPSPPLKLRVKDVNRSAFHPAGTSSSVASLTSSNAVTPQALLPNVQSLPPVPSAPISPPTASTLLTYPPALRMMSSYPSSGMMSFLHPSAAYFAAAAAAASNPQSYSWLFPGSNPYNRSSLLSSHVCLPGCSACPTTIEGSSSGQGSMGSDGGKMMSLTSRNTC